ncbi:hypothetical protein GPECTOR_11g129 [Gonium pectorale]|uniref:Uncharacterized protein n=1 Tax=Gonium pectorale TaxID=33097 RepID=A0A150GPC5_GONPE|nr:hypothetical protein GPECTOR_11g129 [Gonium pectorale]|eukprot:KXZ51677.1 hypothetical protein GPECTOR_11g129 [Gonium pectorale]
MLAALSSASALCSVESLVGRAAVRQLALGDHHTLFLDGDGRLWVCGENKEGQCGLGTPLDLIAAQHRRAYHDTMRQLAETLTAEPRVSREQRGKQAISALMGGGAAPHHAEHASAYGSSGQHQWGSGRSASWQSLMSAGAHTSASGASSTSGARSALHFRGLDFESAFAAAGIQPGQQATPLRIGRDQHPLWAAATAGHGVGAHGASGGWPGDTRMVLSSGLEDETVVGVAASKYFSAALTAAGDVWTFGACYNGSLGTEHSWSTSAQRVSGTLASALDDHGGARQVVSGGSFCAALTAGGKVVVWGKVPGGEGEGGIGGVDATAAEGSGGAIGLTKEGVGLVQGGRLVSAVIPGLPPITHIAAGLQHLLLSDGSRVWFVGRALDGAGAVAGSAPWRRPSLLLTLPDGDAVSQLTAGAHSSGVVSERGAAWVWGRLLDRHHADNVMRRHPNHALGGGGADSAAYLAAAAAPLARDDVHWDWAGFGGRAPARLDGLGGRVKALALGGWHAMAVVE